MYMYVMFLITIIYLLFVTVPEKPHWGGLIKYVSSILKFSPIRLCLFLNYNLKICSFVKRIYFMNHGIPLFFTRLVLPFLMPVVPRSKNRKSLRSLWLCCLWIPVKRNHERQRYRNMWRKFLSGVDRTVNIASFMPY